MTAFRDDVDLVTSAHAVDGQTHRRHKAGRLHAGRVEVVTVERRVLAAAQRAARPGEHLRIVSATRVDIVRDDATTKGLPQ
jgi:hypothetical protein